MQKNGERKNRKAWSNHCSLREEHFRFDNPHVSENTWKHRAHLRTNKKKKNGWNTQNCVRKKDEYKFIFQILLKPLTKYETSTSIVLLINFNFIYENNTPRDFRKVESRIDPRLLLHRCRKNNAHNTQTQKRRVVSDRDIFSHSTWKN